MIFYCARATRAFLSRALREHRRSSASIPSRVPRARRTPRRSLCSLRARSCPSWKGGLVDPRLRVSNEHILIVRVPRAKRTTRLPFPLVSFSLSSLTSQRPGSCVDSTAAVERGPSQGARSGSKESTQLSGLPLSYFALLPLPYSDDIVLVLEPDQRTDEQRKDKKLLSLFIHDGYDREACESGQRPTG